MQKMEMREFRALRFEIEKKLFRNCAIINLVIFLFLYYQGLPTWLGGEPNLDIGVDMLWVWYAVFSAFNFHLVVDETKKVELRFDENMTPDDVQFMMSNAYGKSIGYAFMAGWFTVIFVCALRIAGSIVFFLAGLLIDSFYLLFS